MNEIEAIRRDIISHPDNAWASKQNWQPLFQAHKDARINIVGQAPGRITQDKGIAWDDASGRNLRAWMGIDEQTFYDPSKIAILPMDFYYPGKGKNGDLPPRKGFAGTWHPLLLTQMPNTSMTIVIGQYAMAHELGTRRKSNLTKTVQAFQEYLPKHFALVHPSPRNNIWQKKNLWFVEEVLPVLKKRVSAALN